MKREDRSKAVKLENVIAAHKAFEVRALADLHEAGFTFQSMKAAYQRLSAQATLQGFTQRQIDATVEFSEMQQRKKSEVAR